MPHGRGATDDRIVTAARPEEREPALRLLLRFCPPETLPPRLAGALAMLQKGELDPDGLFVLRRGKELHGAMVASVVPGSSGIVWPPQVINEPDQTEAEDQLIGHVLAWLRRRGALLGQALLPPDELFLAEPLLRHGFHHVTDLLYLRHNRELPPDVFSGAERLTYRSYAQLQPELFSETLERTFVDSLDCPEVTGVRPVEEVIAGFEAQRSFRPDGWWLALEDGRPVGVLLTAALPEEDTWELSYVGVVPEARQRGFGRELVLKAILEARMADVSELFLTVDERNQPARELYRSLGFELFDRRVVMLALWSR
jgi:ribosomal protein S18 acetylase RimI-like enzyme